MEDLLFRRKRLKPKATPEASMPTSRQGNRRVRDSKVRMLPKMPTPLDVHVKLHVAVDLLLVTHDKKGKLKDKPMLITVLRRLMGSRYIPAGQFKNT